MTRYEHRAVPIVIAAAAIDVIGATVLTTVRRLSGSTYPRPPASAAG